MTRTRNKRIGCLLAALILIINVFMVTGCGVSDGAGDGDKSGLPGGANGYGMSAGVLYNSKENDGLWYDTFCYLDQSAVVNLTVEALDIVKKPEIEDFNILYLDKSILAAKDFREMAREIVAFTKNGGTVVLDNAFYNAFDAKYIGAKKFVKLEGCPTEVEFPELGKDLSELQQIIKDFHLLYQSYADYAALAAKDYGYAMVCDTATALAKEGKSALYAVNSYGKGFVFFTNPLLPNAFSISGYDMEAGDSQQSGFASTTAGCNQLLLDAFAGYASKQEFGYYPAKVYGSFGRPAMAWELHYEEITGIENNSMKIFDELCKEYLQIPSFVLIRNPYTWFLRTESVTYYLNEAGGGALTYSLNLNENAYSSGTHIESDGRWLSQGNIYNAGSYFVDYPEYTYRSYPELIDYNKDGMVDIFSGSHDGTFYYYKGKRFDERLHVEAPAMLTDRKGTPLSVGQYSAPNLVDLNSDGYPDLVSGSGDGKIYWFSGDGTLRFEPQGVLLDTDLSGQSLPSVGDLNGDGVADLAVGSNEGILLVYYGTKDKNGTVSYSFKKMDGLSRKCADAKLGKWLAPEIYDYNKDGKIELAVGTFDGYVALFEPDGKNKQKFKGFVTTGEMNYKGNQNVKTGNNCVPVFYDINKDKAPDLVCGSLEYGLAYPIDSPYFPFTKQVKEQIAYAKENQLYMGLHFYTNAYASSEREMYELSAHKAALKKLGMNTEGVGVNQHTWYTSSFSTSQSLLSAWNNGLLWNSGFLPANSKFIGPQTAAENVVSLPFFLQNGNQDTILVQNCSVMPYKGTEWTDISARYDVPICVYFHCDFVYESDKDSRAALKTLSEFWKEKKYNFVKEDQLMKASAAARNMMLTVGGEGISREGTVNLSFTAGMKNTTFPLYDQRYAESMGIKLVFGETVDPAALRTDADVWQMEGNTLYLGLNKPVTVWNENATGKESQEANANTNTKANTDPHIERINIPAVIRAEANGLSIQFSDGGMMQVVVNGAAQTTSQGWQITETDGKTIFTKYGAADALNISY